MDSARRRLAAAGLALIALWVAVYWLWDSVDAAPSIVIDDSQPAGAAITFDSSEDDLAAAPRQAPVQQAAQPDPAPAEETRRPEPERTVPAVLAPEFTSYSIRAGDSFQKIARGAYGDSSLWTVIATANPRVDPTKLRVGMTIRIPVDPANVQGRPVDVPSTSPPPAASSIEYVVARGDTLGQISKTYYNTTTLWQVILDANRHVLTDPKDLRPGMRLTIPPDPRGAQ